MYNVLYITLAKDKTIRWRKQLANWLNQSAIIVTNSSHSHGEKPVKNDADIFSFSHSSKFLLFCDYLLLRILCNGACL